ncbi:AbrB/MazE/SpoVT family DNA-binding domain-containing protein [Chelativorans sp.]|uniref:antitoxin n=1 Tax=Chelativorans sp. TaxID=2203393 RepID=UPI00281125D0|nr:AbrB/MazE/SpoVT family DNA-binding domain-containing protein [Chelativorans sp.]
MNVHQHDDEKRVVRVFQNGRSKAVRIPKEWEFAADTVVMRQLPDGSIMIRTGATAGLVAYLKNAEPWTGGDFIEDDRHLPPLDDVEFP